MALMTGPLSPYVTPDMLSQFPVGVAWSNIPDPRASPAEKYAALVLICQTATGMADTHANQILRSSSQTETLRGPGAFRVHANSDGTVRLLLSQRPITNITAIQVAPSVPLPYQFTSVTQGCWAIAVPPLLVTGSSAAADSGIGGQAVILGPGWVGGGNRGGWVINTTYTAGWPLCGLTQAANPGDQILHVDDCTGWAPTAPGLPGVTGVVQDTATGQQEAATCLASSTPTGPGILDLASPVTYAHNPGILVSALPNQIQWATALFAGAQALARGSTTTTIQTARGGSQKNAGGSESLRQMACDLLHPFRRVE